MCTELSERVCEAAELIFEHAEVAMHDKDIRKKYRTVDKIVGYLWEALNRMGVDDSELGFQLIEKKLVTSEEFHIHIRKVWKKMVWDILQSGRIIWPYKNNMGIGG